MKLNEIKNLENNISGVYMIICTYNNIKYIGSSNDIKRRIKNHLSSLRSNIHHNKILQESFNKFGENNFVFRILEKFTGSDYEIKKLERNWYNKIKDNGAKTANIANPLYGTSGMKFKRSKDFCKKISGIIKEKIKEVGLPKGFGGQAKTFLGHKHTKETKEIMSQKHKGINNPMYGKKYTKEERERLSKAHLGFKHSKESKQKISLSKTGKPNGHEGMKYNEEWRKNISNSLKGKSTWAKGKHFSEEHKRKISESNKGKKLSEETRKKIKFARAKQIMPKWSEERRKKFNDTIRKREEMKNENK